MRFRPLLMLAACALAASAHALAQEQQKEQKVIDDFVTTRGATSDAPRKAAGRRSSRSKQGAQSSSGTGRRNSRAQAGSPAGKSAPAQASNEAAGAGGVSGAAAQTAQAAGAKPSKGGAAQRPIALGYTLLLKDDSQRLTVVEPSHAFKTGDRIAVTLETNADGYLYMFNATDGKNPEMLFPNPQLDGGANTLQAHTRATFPADPEHDIQFTDPPAAEHLFVVFSREPLAGVPAGEALLEFCGERQEDCVWKPTAAQWDKILSAARARGVTEARNTQLAQAAPPVKPDALARGLKVKRNDPGPAVVRVNNTPDPNLLVTEIVLTHR